MLPERIDDSQSAFVKERLITEDAITGMETFHLMKTGRPFFTGDYMAVKLDMMKACDRIEWQYLE